MVFGDVQIQADHRPFDVHARPDARRLAELIADGIFHTPRSVLRMRDIRIAHIAIDGKRVVRRHPSRPVNGPHHVVEFVRVIHIGFDDRLQYANGRAQPEISSIEE